LGGLAALEPLIEGRVEVSDLDVRLTGVAQGVAARDTVLATVAAAPLGTWQTELETILPVAAPYRFSVTKGETGLIFAGNAPDEAVAARLRERLIALSGGDVEGAVTLAQGMPGAGWPGLVEEGIGALALMRAGTLEVSDGMVRLTGDLDTDADRRRLAALTRPGWDVTGRVLNPTPPAELVITVAPGAPPLVTGTVPAGLASERLVARVPAGDLTAVSATGGGDPARWEAAMAALTGPLAALETGELWMLGDTLGIRGQVRPGLSAIETETALLSALAPGWDATVALTDAALPAAATLIKDGDGLSLSGTLPEGLAAEEALALLDAAGTELSSGGTGEASAWRDVLPGLRSLAGVYDRMEARLEGESLSIDGTLAPGQSATRTQLWAGSAFPGWQVALAGTETEASEGDARLNLYTGETEVLARGFWLPELEIEASADACSEAASRALTAEKITFVTGSAEIDAAARVLLNRLSAVALTCLNTGALRLEVAGHTDDVGDDAANQALSEARAEAVRTALEARGVAPGAISATGFGETQPIADNATEDGRARNRRIDFTFTE
ncbi:MAG: OmpA family protein, partial [Pseudomonadota bacterium]